MAEVQEPSRLESLPAELRNRIYRYAVVREQPYDLSSKDTRVEVVDPALAFVNRSIRREVMPVFYGSSLFTIHMRGDAFLQDGLMRSWLRRRNDCVKLMKHFAVTADERRYRCRLSVSIGNHFALTVKISGLIKKESKCICAMKSEKFSMELVDVRTSPIDLLIACVCDMVATTSNDLLDMSCKRCMGHISGGVDARGRVYEEWEAVTCDNEAAEVSEEGTVERILLARHSKFAAS